MGFEFDPLKHFSTTPEVQELIFQHFNFNDLMILSNVSSAFHNFIFETETCLDKIKIIVNVDNLEDVRSSTKKHQHIKIDRKVEKKDAEYLLSRNPKWKSIEVTGVYDVSQFTNLIELTLHEVLNGSETTFELPNLKVLNLRTCHRSIAKSLIAGSENLRKISVANIQKIDVLLTEITSLPLPKLEELAISEYSTYNFDHSKTELLEFLKVHAEKLRSLKMDIWVGVAVLKLIMTMPKLRELELYELAKSGGNVDWDTLELLVNSEIQRLLIHDLSKNKKLLKCIVKSCPDTLELDVYELSCDALKILNEHLPNLKKLSVVYIDKNLVREDFWSLSLAGKDAHFLLFKDFKFLRKVSQRSRIEELLLNGSMFKRIEKSI